MESRKMAQQITLNNMSVTPDDHITRSTNFLLLGQMAKEHHM